MLVQKAGFEALAIKDTYKTIVLISGSTRIQENT